MKTRTKVAVCVCAGTVCVFCRETDMCTYATCKCIFSYVPQTGWQKGKDKVDSILVISWNFGVLDLPPELN